MNAEYFEFLVEQEGELDRYLAMGTLERLAYKGIVKAFEIREYFNPRPYLNELLF